jgi:hypothetical protein
VKCFLVKTIPQTLVVSEIVKFSERRIKRAAPKPGDQMYIWTAEEKGGKGLVAKGVIQATDTDAVSVGISETWPKHLVSNAELAPHRDSPTNPLLHGLARIYRYSHLQIVELTSQEVAFFEGLVP